MVNWEFVSTIGAGGSTGAGGERYGLSSISVFYPKTSRGNGNHAASQWDLGQEKGQKNDDRKMGRAIRG
jgi:hypothetical protein